MLLTFEAGRRGDSSSVRELVTGRSRTRASFSGSSSTSLPFPLYTGLQGNTYVFRSLLTVHIDADTDCRMVTGPIEEAKAHGQIEEKQNMI